MKLFIGIPNLIDVNYGIFEKLAYWSTKSGHEIRVSMLPEARFHDWARNQLCREFLSTDCSHLIFLDSDIDPNTNLIRLPDYGKDVIGGNTMCWQKNEIMPSVWASAACEECKCVKIWQQVGRIEDERNYIVDPEAPAMLHRWNPYQQRYEKFYDREKREFAPGCQCRCRGSGRDPFVYQVHRGISESGPIKVDAVGGASLCIARHVLEAMTMPYFQFLFRPSREILVTEDLLWCYKAKQLGFEIWAVPELVCGHFKRVNLLNINQWAGKIFELGKQEGARNGRRIAVSDFQ